MTSDWKVCKIEDITDILGDGLHGTPKYTEDGKYAFVNGNNLVNGHIEIKPDTKRVAESEYLKYKKTLNDRTLLVSINGTLGNVAEYNNEKIILGKSACYFNVKENVSKTFIKYILISKTFQNYLENNATGTTIKNISLKQMREYEFLLPPLETQQKIAKVLSAIDDKIELNNSINKNLEQQAQAIFKSWFIDFEPFGGTMPDDWGIGVLEDIVEFSNGYAFKSSELLNAPENECFDVFKQGHINRGGGFNPTGTKSWYPKEKAKSLEKYILKKGDVLMAMTDMKDNVAILGNTALMEVDNKYIVNQRVGLLRCKNDMGISYPYIYILTNSTDFLTDLRKRANSGVQVNLSSTEIKNSEVLIAPKEINVRFDNIIKPFFEQIFANDIENERLTQLRDTLLPKLMNGEIDVDKVEV